MEKHETLVALNGKSRPEAGKFCLEGLLLLNSLDFAVLRHHPQLCPRKRGPSWCEGISVASSNLPVYKNRPRPHVAHGLQPALRLPSPLSFCQWAPRQPRDLALTQLAQTSRPTILTGICGCHRNARSLEPRTRLPHLP